MKKIIFLLSFLIFSSLVFAQNISHPEKIQTTTVNDFIQIDIFFNEPINPKTITFQNILVNENQIGSTTKFIFNRDGTQVRFKIDFKDNFTLKLQNIKTINGNNIFTDIIYLNGDSTWKKS